MSYTCDLQTSNSSTSMQKMSDTSPSRSLPVSNAQAPHALTFRVMRLTTPLPPRTSAPPLIPRSGDSHDAGDSEQVQSQTAFVIPRSPPWQAEGAPCGVGHLTVLPSSFGSIYASETFRSFISVFNRHVGTVFNVSVTIQMDTPSSRRIALFDSTNNLRATLKTRASINNIVSVPLPELGVHVLVCTATYFEMAVPSAAGPRMLRQFFRFNVLPPVDLTPSVYPLPRQLEVLGIPAVVAHAQRLGNASHFLVHVRVHNAIPVSVYATTATFVAKSPYHVRAVGANERRAVQSTAKGDSAMDSRRRATMAGGDSRNFIFVVFSYIGESRRLDTSGSASNLKIEKSQRQVNLGTVSVKWRSALGEDGGVDRDISTIARDPTSSAVSVSIYAVPHQVRAHQPFVARCAARNNSARAVRLYLQIRRDLVGEIVPVGVSGVSLGEVGPSKTGHCAITLIALVRGQHNISGVRVVEMDSNISYKAEAPTITVS